MDIHFHFAWVMPKNGMAESLLAWTLDIWHLTIPQASGVVNFLKSFFSLFFSLDNSTDLYSSSRILSSFTSILLLNPCSKFFIPDIYIYIFFWFQNFNLILIYISHVSVVVVLNFLFIHSLPLNFLYLTRWQF